MCLHPLEIYTRRTSSPYSKVGVHLVPCGKCVQCSNRSQNDWRFRLIQETLSHPKAIFGTLTYREDEVPVCIDEVTGEATPTVFAPDVSKWIHRSVMRLVRAGIKNPRYFVCSEYGTSTFRPHYHFIWWNVSRFDFVECLQDWQEKFGFTQCSDIDVSKAAAAAVYVSKYAIKGQFEVYPVKESKCAPNFHFQSQGIGKDYLNSLQSFVRKYKGLEDFKSSTNKDFLEQIYRRLNYVSPDGKVFALPRYYVSKIIPPKSPLALAYSQYVRDRSTEQYESRAREIADSSSLTFYQALSQVQTEEIAERVEQSKSLLERQNKFYYKSKI